MVTIEKTLLDEHQSELFRHLWDASPDPLLLVGKGGVIVLVNDQMTRLTGYTREELEGQRLELLLPERYKYKHVALREDFSRHPRVREMGAGYDLTLCTKDHRELPVEVSLSPLKVGRDEVIFTIATVRDITERKRVREELQHHADALARSNAELEQFAYVASHDLQEPLRMISGYVQLLQRRYKGKLDASADEFIKYAVDGTKRMQELITDLLTYSRVNAKGVDLVPTPLGDVVKRVLQSLEFAIQECHADINVGPLPTILADRTQMGQLFQNLIANAIKFHGDKPPKVTVTAKQVDGFWEIMVKDEGIGIAKEYQEKIFVIFQRLHTRDKYPGTGIGLAICKKIVESHKGSIRVESEPGKGTAFYIRIPD